MSSDNEIISSPILNLIKTENYSNTIIDKILSADVVFLPNKFVDRGINRCFPDETPEFKKYLIQKIPNKNIVLAEEDEINIKLLELNDSSISIPIICFALDFVKAITIQVLASFIVEYFKQKYVRDYRNNTLNIDLTLYINDKKSNKAIKFKYKGDSKGLDIALKNIDINKLAKKDE